MAMTIKDALRLAAKDQHFANEIMTNPEAYRAQFNLTDAQVQQLKHLASAAAKAKTSGGLGPAADYDWALAGMTNPEFIGILPAAGLGSRLPSLRAPKELLPIAFVADPATGAARPMVAAEYSLGAMQRAGVRKCLIVTSDRKPEIFRYFGDGSGFGLAVAYLNQAEPDGLAAAIDMAFPWVERSCVSLALPDSVFSPCEAVAAVNQALVTRHADVMLGVFPTVNPAQLGPVRIGTDGRVIEVLEKPTLTDVANTWGIAAWTPRFTDFLHRQGARIRGLSIGHVFNDAIPHGLDVRALVFEAGSYADLGTGESLAAMIFGRWSEDDEEADIRFARAGRGGVG